MLKTRILTALVLLFAFLGALFFLPAAGWLAVATLLALAAFWEWGGFMALPKRARLLLVALALAFCALFICLSPQALGLDAAAGTGQAGRWLYLPSIVFWLLLVPFWLRQRWTLERPLVGALTGALVILPTWLAFVQLRQHGALVLLAIMATVWIADIAAYFTGRACGRRKLAPEISPNKTWEGAIGGVLAVVVYGFAVVFAQPGGMAVNPALLCVALLGVAALSIVGDLFESLLKRQAGLKDSGSLLPGHGGVMDRIDSLTSTLPLIAMLWPLVSP